MSIHRLSAFVTSTFLSARLTRSAFHSCRIQRSPYTSTRTRRSLTMVATPRSAPGVLDTDAQGGVLIAPRDGCISVSTAPSLADYATELLIIAVWAPEDDDADFVLPDAVAALNSSGVLDELVADAEFKGKSGSSTDVVRVVGSSAKRIGLYGLGKKSAGPNAASAAAKYAVQKAMAVKSCTTVGLFIDAPSDKAIASAAEGAHVGAYIDERYKEKKESEKVPTELQIVGVASSAETTAAIARGCAIATGVITTKEVITAPANALTPATLALAAEMVAKEVGLTAKVMGRAECEALGMGSYLGVGRGSTDEPKFIHLTYSPPDGVAKKKLCVVGKAVTFDTGGTNLKVGKSMIELMKFDMGGAGVALGTAKAIGTLKPKGVEVHFIMPAVENMLSDRAIHPGDVLKASNGKTVEVINTDAEGRLCLADALVYAEKLGEVDYIVDMATLTGAIIIALGNEVTGMWTPSDEFSEELLSASKAVGEQMWRMPLVEEYTEQLKSKCADLRNIGAGGAGSSIIAALFLKEFVTTKQWAHLDIAGTCWYDKKGGATGWGVKTMVQWIETHSSA